MSLFRSDLGTLSTIFRPRLFQSWHFFRKSKVTRILFKFFDSYIFNQKRPAVLCRQKEKTASCHRMWCHGGMLRLTISLSWILTKNLTLHCTYLLYDFFQLETPQVTMSWCVSTLVLPMQHCQRITASTRCVGILSSTRGPPFVAFAVAFGSDSTSFWSLF